MDARKDDLRARRTRRAIRAAFEEMICEMDAQRIGVTELAARAQINRKTFYLHYPTIEALFEEVLEELMDDFFEQVETTPDEPKDLAGHARRFFMFLAGQREPVERLICQAGTRDYGRQLYRMQMHRYKQAGNPFDWMDAEERDLVLHFIRSTALDFYRRWVRRGKEVPAERAAELLCELTCHGASRLMR